MAKTELFKGKKVWIKMNHKKHIHCGMIEWFNDSEKRIKELLYIY